MKGVNWSIIRKVSCAVIVCLGITVAACEDRCRVYIHYSLIAMTAKKVLTRRHGR
jgi:hypothetical protein